MEENDESIKRTGGKETELISPLSMPMQDGKPYVLPPWRLNEIVMLALETLISVDFCREDFNYQKMITDRGIKIKKFSSFSPENLELFTSLSLSQWTEGVCLVFRDKETGEQKRMIAYNDSRNAAEVMQIILHEFAHIIMRHTQQSVNGEVEATCFALTMMLFIIIERRFHLGQTIIKTAGKFFLLKEIKKELFPPAQETV